MRYPPRIDPFASLPSARQTAPLPGTSLPRWTRGTKSTPPPASLYGSARKVVVVALLALCVFVVQRRLASNDSRVGVPDKSQGLAVPGSAMMDATVGAPLANRRSPTFARDRPGTISFPAFPLHARTATPEIDVPLTIQAFPTFFPVHPGDCLDRFVASGELCFELGDASLGPRLASLSKISIVWTWTNGSDARMSAWRDHVASKVRSDGAADVPGSDDSSKSATSRHFRDHDELRFSLRSVVASIPRAAISSIHLLVGDTPLRFPSDRAPEDCEVTQANGARNFAEAPRWLDVGNHRVQLSALDDSDSTMNTTRFLLEPHSALFTATDLEADGTLRERRPALLPTFSSGAIESQFAWLETTTPELFYLNDDCFIAQNLSISDLTSPLTGPVFRMFRGFVVEGPEPGQARDDREGEWPALRTSNWLLDRRFGKRSRPYLAHIAKTLSLPMLREVWTVWTEEHEEAGASRFRGQGEMQFATQFLSIHYQIEKHREALLWSYLVARTDRNHDGKHDREERLALLDELMSDAAFDDDSETLYALMPSRRTLPTLESLSTPSNRPAFWAINDDLRDDDEDVTADE
ncbi:hypothetical protein JCM10212_007019 [Sporobolomyces blumeae]